MPFLRAYPTTDLQREHRNDRYDPQHLAAAVVLAEPFVLRTIAFDMPTFDLLKGLQWKLEGIIRKGDTSNAEVLKYLLHTHPETRQAAR